MAGDRSGFCLYPLGLQRVLGVQGVGAAPGFWYEWSTLCVQGPGAQQGAGGPLPHPPVLGVPPSLSLLLSLLACVWDHGTQTCSRESFQKSAVPPAQAAAPQKPGLLASSSHLGGPAQRARPGGRGQPPQGLQLSSSGHWKVWSLGPHPAWGGIRGGGLAGAGSWSSGPSFVPHTSLSFPIGSPVSRARLSQWPSSHLGMF